jgi:thiosulfate reductase cytochrome b subunit
MVRITHWITVLAFLALLITGAEIVISHPRFYWGETGNVMTPPLFTLPIPASRDTVPTRFHYVMPDQNGWSRYLHFQAAWAAVLTGLLYAIASLWSGHFRRDIFPSRAQRTWQAVRDVLTGYRHRSPPEFNSYNAIQRIAYILVIFVLFPLVIWTGLALSPSFDSAFPAAVNLLGGRQSARTIHFLVTLALVLFFVVHVVMVALSGFRSRMRAMTIGEPEPQTHPTPALVSQEPV